MKDVSTWQKDMNRLFDIIEDNPSERKMAFSRLKEIRSQVEDSLKCLKDDLAENEKIVMKYEHAIHGDYVPASLKEEALDNIDDKKVTIHKLKDEISELEELKATLDEYFAGQKFFDKYKCFQNIRKLMPEKGVKLGQIESEAGVRTGYMSRLEKPENDSEPGILFLVSAAHLLGVTIDELIYSDPSELTKDERYVNDFLLDLIKDTDAHDIQWERENEKILNNVYFIYNGNTPNHPLLFADDNQLDDDGTPLMVRYYSPFYRESTTKVKGCYSASLPDTTSRVYIVLCDIEKVDKDIPNNEFYEVYVTNDEDKANPICNTLKSASAIGTTMDSLYKLAMSDATSVHIDKNTRSIIDAYRRRHEPLPF